MIHPNTTEFVYPNRPYMYLFLTSKEFIELHCPGSRLEIQGLVREGFVLAKCIGGEAIEIDNEIFPIHDVTCTAMVSSRIIKYVIML